MKKTVATFCLVVAASACSRPGPPAAVAPAASTIAIVESPTVASPEARALVEANDRTDADRQLDPGRHPAELITFLGITPGMRIAEFIAGAGYTAELLARAVAPNGTVYAENPKFILVRAAVPWSERLARPANKTI
jgi:predicted methyltransferase